MQTFKLARGAGNVTAPLIVSVLAVAGFALGTTTVTAQESCPSSAELTAGLASPLNHIRFLADDALAGREVGTPGARCAGEYIAERFRSFGLEPAGPTGSYFQSFEVRSGATLGANNMLSVSEATYTVREDWIPYGFSPAGHLSGRLVYGGQTMDAPADQVHAGVSPDVSGRIVVVEDGSPSGQGLQSDPHFKAAAAAERGATALLVLLAEGAELPDPLTENRPNVKIPVVAVAPAAARTIRDAAQAESEVALMVDVAPNMVEARNVLGLLRGTSGASSDEVVIVGAHFDHLGLGGDGSLAPDEYGAIHNGADDNGSGSAALLQAAETLTSAAGRPARSVLFLAMTGEEKGLLGASHYVKEPVMPLERTVAMLNMDMVGRLREDKLTVFGIGTAEEWQDIVESVNGERDDPFELILTPDGYGPSDHAAFYGEGVPVLHFFTNTHEDYHRPSDDWDKIDIDGLSRISDFVSDVTLAVAGEASAAERVASLTPLEGAGNPHGQAPVSSSDEAAASSGYGPFFGSIPDMTPQDFGVRLTGVREGSPAQKAGIQSGDVIVGFGGKDVSDLYAYTYALREHAPGDEVEVVVLRDGERVTLTAVLEARR